MNTQFPYDIDKTTIFPFFLIETPGKFVPLNDFEEIALLTKIFNKLKQSYLLTRF